MDLVDRLPIKSRSKTYGENNPIPDYDIRGSFTAKNTEGPQLSVS
jgi:hypothetical protein